LKATIKLEVNNKVIELTLVEALELREQLNALTGLGDKKSLDLPYNDSGWNIHYPTITVGDQPIIYANETFTTSSDAYKLLPQEENT
jgi:hypothetical protein